MSWRRWRPSKAIGVGGRARASPRRREVRAAARRRSGPVRRRSATSPSGSRVVPAWKTSGVRRVAGVVEPVDRVAAARVVRVAGRREHDRRPSRRAASAAWPCRRVDARSAPRAAARSSGPSAHGQPRQDDLGLGIAEAGVALEQDRAVGGQHQAGVQGAAERRAAPGQLGEDRRWIVSSERAAASASAGRRAG